MNKRRLHSAPLVAGAIFVVLGAALLLDALDLATIDPGIVWPLALIAAGIAVLARRATR